MCVFVIVMCANNEMFNIINFAYMHPKDTDGRRKKDRGREKERDRGIRKKKRGRRRKMYKYNVITIGSLSKTS